jgi:hypothetical protein
MPHAYATQDCGCGLFCCPHPLNCNGKGHTVLRSPLLEFAFLWVLHHHRLFFVPAGGLQEKRRMITLPMQNIPAIEMNPVCLNKIKTKLLSDKLFSPSGPPTDADSYCGLSRGWPRTQPMGPEAHRYY